jgi:hypothetical protein
MCLKGLIKGCKKESDNIDICCNQYKILHDMWLEAGGFLVCLKFDLTAEQVLEYFRKDIKVLSSKINFTLNENTSISEKHIIQTELVDIISKYLMKREN